MNEYDKKRVWAKGLIVECPLGDALEDCPLNEIRKLPLRERLQIIKKMSDEELDEAIAHHEQCLKNREA